MTRKEATREACAIMALVYHSLRNYEHASDGFCDRCPFGESKAESHFRHDGKTFSYIRHAVLEKFKRDKIKVAEGFDPKTGRERQ